jgi:cobalt-precorrin-5B (C1)-methyltransferase
MPKKQLRHGFTTGSAAAAASKAGILYLATKKMLREIDIPLPEGGRLTIPVEQIEELPGRVRATVIKDAGDDPDVTHRAKIRSTVHISSKERSGSICIEGGEGVGRVTKPGLPLDVGEPAINPVPRQQIREAVLEGIKQTELVGDVSIIIDVVDGKKIAEKTLNPRLGILGGISILGTRGTVIPYSAEAYMDSITMSMDIARAENLEVIALSTGGRTEKLLMKERPDMPESAFIEVADFFSFSLHEASKRGFLHILYSCFFGKLVKMAQGYPYTHARDSAIDFDRLSYWCAALGMDQDRVKGIRNANTAREVLGILVKDNNRDTAIKEIMKKALVSARNFTGPGPEISIYLFDFDGGLLTTMNDAGVAT